ncbi:MAG: hypothetical protein ACI8SJ_002004 [Shewanella sp.]|jgi:hypothetical protein
MLTILVSIWAVLMLRSVIAEYQYYNAVKTLEPQIWQELGTPRTLKIPIVFLSAKGSARLQEITHETIELKAKAHRQARVQLLAYIALVLVFSTLYFKLA